MRTEFGQFVAIERIKASLTALEVAKRIGVSTPFLSMVEHGNKCMSVKRATKLLNLFPTADADEFWRLYYQGVNRIPVYDLPEYKRRLIATIVTTDLPKAVAEAIEETIYGLA